MLAGTPWWVYVIFIYLMYVGIKASRSQELPITRLIIVPLIFIVWSLYSLYVRYGFNVLTASLWITSLIVGASIGWLVLSRGIRINKHNKLVYLPGSWYPLFFYLLFFIVKYYIGFIYAIDPKMRWNLFFIASDIFASGFISGLFAGRFLRIRNLLYV